MLLGFPLGRIPPTKKTRLSHRSRLYHMFWQQSSRGSHKPARSTQRDRNLSRLVTHTPYWRLRNRLRMLVLPTPLSHNSATCLLDERFHKLEPGRTTLSGNEHEQPLFPFPRMYFRRLTVLMCIRCALDGRYYHKTSECCRPILGKSNTDQEEIQTEHLTSGQTAQFQSWF
jgi:hypothetical protein